MRRGTPPVDDGRVIAPAAAAPPRTDSLLEHPRSLALLLVLTFSTGVADAVGYLGLDKVFTGNMTGNIVILGMGLASEDELPVAGPLAAFVAYMAGATAAGFLLRSNGARWTSRVTAVFAVNAVVLVVTACLLAAGTVRDQPFAVMGIAASIALLMGALTACGGGLLRDVVALLESALTRIPDEPARSSQRALAALAAAVGRLHVTLEPDVPDDAKIRDAVDEVGAAIGRLVDVASSDTGQAARVADFLLAWWNGDDNGHFPILHLSNCDAIISEDMLIVMAWLAQEPAIYPDAWGYRDAMVDLVGRWRLR